MSQSSVESNPSSQEIGAIVVKTMDGPNTRTRAAFSNLTNAVQKQTLGKKSAPKSEENQGDAKKKVRISRSTCKDDKNGEPINVQWDKLEILKNPFDIKIDPVRHQLKNFVIDLDSNILDPNELPEYGFVMFEYMRARENYKPINGKYLEKQADVNEKMRQVLIDWMVEMQESFQLAHETLYLSVTLVDLFMSTRDVKREDMQLLAATAILLAAKFYERYPPYLDDLVFVCDEAYTRAQFLKTEMDLLITVDYDINFPVSYLFQRRYARAVNFTMPQLTRARYVLELSLMEYSFVCESASKMAAACLLWTLLHMKKDWNDSLEFHSSHSRKELMPIVRQLNEMIVKAPKRKLRTIFDKYSHENFFKVAKKLKQLDEDALTGVFEEQMEMEISLVSQ